MIWKRFYGMAEFQITSQKKNDYIEKNYEETT